jgi:hypothetical protein
VELGHYLVVGLVLLVGLVAEPLLELRLVWVLELVLALWAVRVLHRG